MTWAWLSSSFFSNKDAQNAANNTNNNSRPDQDEWMYNESDDEEDMVKAVRKPTTHSTHWAKRTLSSTAAIYSLYSIVDRPPLDLSVEQCKIPFWLFCFDLIVQLLTGLSPVFRLGSTNAGEASGNSNAIQEQLIAITVLDWCRIIFFWIVMYMQSGRNMWRHLLIFDNLMARSLIFSLAYIGILFGTQSNWVYAACVTDFFFSNAYAGNVRVMVKFYTFNWNRLFFYRLVLFFNPVFFAFTGIYYIYITPAGWSKTIFTFYLIVGINYHQDLYVRSTLVTTPARHPASTWATKTFAYLLPPPAPKPVASVPSSLVPDSSVSSSATALLTAPTASSSAAPTILAPTVAATASTAAGPAVPPIVADSSPPATGLYLIELIAVVLIEVYSSCSPLYRLSLEQADEDNNSLFENAVVSDWLRIFFFLYIMIRLRHTWTDIWPNILVFDNLFTRELILTITYDGMVGFDPTSTVSHGWIQVAIMTDLAFTLVYAAHLRTMINHYPFTRNFLFLYKWQRLLGPFGFVLTACVILLNNETTQLAGFLLYAVCGLNFYFDVYVKLSLVRPRVIPPRATPKDDEIKSSRSISASEFRLKRTPSVLFMLNRAKAAFHEENKEGNVAVRDSAAIAAAVAATTNSSFVDPLKPEPIPPPKTALGTLKWWEFTVTVIVEILSSSSPITRLIDRSPMTEVSDTQLTNTAIATLFTDWARVAVWLYIAWRLRRQYCLKDFLRLDALWGRVFLLEMVYAFLIYATMDQNWQYVLLPISDFFLNFIFSGYFRIMLKYHTWTPWLLEFYRFQRLYTPCVFAMVGVYFIFSEPASSTYRKNLFVYYTILGTAFFYDVYVRAANTTLPAPPKPPEPSSLDSTSDTYLRLIRSPSSAPLPQTPTNALAPSDSARWAQFSPRSGAGSDTESSNNRIRARLGLPLRTASTESTVELVSPISRVYNDDLKEDRKRSGTPLVLSSPDFGNSSSLLNTEPPIRDTPVNKRDTRKHKHKHKHSKRKKKSSSKRLLDMNSSRDLLPLDASVDQPLRQSSSSEEHRIDVDTEADAVVLFDGIDESSRNGSALLSSADADDETSLVRSAKPVAVSSSSADAVTPYLDADADDHHDEDGFVAPLRAGRSEPDFTLESVQFGGGTLYVSADSSDDALLSQPSMSSLAPQSPSVSSKEVSMQDK